MRILVHPHELIVGGSQVNAIELAAAVRDRGHLVTIVATHGPLTERIVELDLDYVQLGDARRPRTFSTSVRGLRRELGSGSYDVLHCYEFRACTEGWGALGARRRPAMVLTDMSMKVHPHVPKTVPLIVGTRALRDDAKGLGVRNVFTIQPPVDTDRDDPSVKGDGFLRDHGSLDAGLKVVMVSRLTRDLKLEGIERTIAAVTELDRPSVQLIIVGDGECRQDLQDRVRSVNESLGRPSVILAGPMVDARPAYAMADVVVGMGHSALRGMSFCKPVIVVGRKGFSEIVSPANIDLFRHIGFYSDQPSGVPRGRLSDQLAELLDNPRRREQLGAFGRDVVMAEYSLSAAAGRLEAIYDEQRRIRRSLGVDWLRDTRDLTTTLVRGKSKHLRARLVQAGRRGAS